jgi:dienelactone hydrolase
MVVGRGRLRLGAIWRRPVRLAPPARYGRGVPAPLYEAAAAQAPVDPELVRYPEAGHGFHCDARSAYHEASARDAWARTLAWFDEHLA